MLFKTHKGFTLVELLVVISILGVLAAALTTQVTKARNMGQSIRCKASLKNLAQAALNYAVEKHSGRPGAWQPEEIMPWAGSHEGSWPGADASGNYVQFYHECPGWVGWTGSGRWKSRDPQSGAMTPACFYGDKNTTYHSLSNGVLWSYVGGDMATFVCDVHKAAAKRAKLDNVRRSYVMNGYFGYDYRSGAGARQAVGRSVQVHSLSDRGNAGGLLLFAELPAFKLGGGTFKESVDNDKKSADGVLEAVIKGYATNPSREELLGFNHQVGKRFVAHVAYADGHVDVIAAPQDPTDTKLKDLTFFLCNGVDIPSDSKDWPSQRSEFLK